MNETPTGARDPADRPGQGEAASVDGAWDAERPASSGTIVVSIKVPPMYDGWRLDHFLKHRIGRLSRTRIQRIITSQITLPGRRARPASSVRAGEILTLCRPAPREPEVPRDFGVLYEDDMVRVIDKPAGLPMHTTAKFWRNTLVAILREREPHGHNEIAHRIDRETSGVLLIARTRAAGAALKRAFASRLVEKVYLALVKGQPPAEGHIDAPLKLQDTPTHIMMGVASRADPDALPATTHFHVVRRFRDHALVAVSPRTGRQHQIRVHLAHLGHPLVGDKLYGAGEQYFMEACDGGLTPALLERFDGLERHALHAHRLTFPHPRDGRPFCVESPLPPDLTGYIDRLLPPIA